ncbi:MAG: hypothetical protein JJU36_03150 [Phycisphaeraceae bacterium]|nr:hypothetical protein [Phycisphaeraceae bacterium]
MRNPRFSVDTKISVGSLLMILAAASFSFGAADERSDSVEEEAKFLSAVVEEALVTARSVEPAHKRVFVLCSVALSQSKLGDIPKVHASFEEALATARAINDPEDKVRGLGDVGMGRMRTGDADTARLLFAEARNLALKIEDRSTRDSVLVSLAWNQNRVGLYDDAIRTTRDIDCQFFRAWALPDLAAGQMKAGNPEAARVTLTEIAAMVPDIEFSHEKLIVIRTAARRNEELGDTVNGSGLTEVVSTFEFAQNDVVFDTDRLSLAISQAMFGLFGEALRTADRIQSARDKAKALGYISYSKASAGLHPQALATARRIQVEFYKTGGLLAVASRLKEADQIATARTVVAEALDACGRIECDRYKRGALTAVAEFQAKLGDEAAARRTFAEALAIARRIDDAEERMSALMFVSSSQAKAGFFGDALKTAREIEDSHTRVRALSELALEQAKAGEIEEARARFSEAKALSGEIHDPEQRLEARRIVGTLQHDARMTLEALATFRQIEDPYWKAYTLATMIIAIVDEREAQ